TVVAGFLAHEPCAVLLGLRGTRAGRELRGPAMRWLGTFLVVGAMTGLGALATIDPGARWSVAVPLAAALPLIIATIRHQQKSWHGEIAASLVCAGAAVPIAMAAGATTKTASAVAIPFALLFVASTLGVRVVILRVRRGGDPKAPAATRRAALSFTVGSAAMLALLTASKLLAA